MPWILDTNVISEFRKPRPDNRIVQFIAETPLEELYISIVTLAEVRYGIEFAPDHKRRDELDLWLATLVRPMFYGRVLDISEDVLVRWRVFVGAGRRLGRTFSQPDLMIAATAMERGFTLVTRNIRDFAGLPMVIFNPWE